MCRMCLATFTDTNIPKLDLVHEMMLRTCHDEMGQKDGWGITDGIHTWTSPRWYYEEIPIWKTTVDGRRVVMSHIRKASGGTGRTRIESHPYTFMVDGHKLLAMHNGFFSGGVHPAYQQNVPNTDSYRAFVRLTTMLEGKTEITPDLINEWLSEYRDDSHYAVIIKWRGFIYALRGKSRNLAMLQVGNGYLVNTNILALHFAKDYIQGISHVEVNADPQPIPDNTMIKFRAGSIDIEVFDLAPKHAAAYVQQTVWQTTPPKSEPLSTVRNGGGNVSDDVQRVGFITAPAVTKPRKQRPEALVTEFEGMTLKERRTEFSKLANMLSPLRSDLSAYWCASILQYFDANGRPSPSLFLSSVTAKELEILKNTLCPMLADDPEKYLKPFAPAAMYMINWWNHHVIYGADSAVHELLFTQGMFFLNDAFTCLTDLSGVKNNPQYIMSVWVPYMLQLISYIAPSARRKYFNEDKLLDTAHMYLDDSTPISFSTEMILRGDRTTP